MGASFYKGNVIASAQIYTQLFPAKHLFTVLCFHYDKHKDDGQVYVDVLQLNYWKCDFYKRHGKIGFHCLRFISKHSWANRVTFFHYVT